MSGVYFSLVTYMFHHDMCSQCKAQQYVLIINTAHAADYFTPKNAKQ